MLWMTGWNIAICFANRLLQLGVTRLGANGKDCPALSPRLSATPRGRDVRIQQGSKPPSNWGAYLSSDSGGEADILSSYDSKAGGKEVEFFYQIAYLIAILVQMGACSRLRPRTRGWVRGVPLDLGAGLGAGSEVSMGKEGRCVPAEGRTARPDPGASLGGLNFLFI